MKIAHLFTAALVAATLSMPALAVTSTTVTASSTGWINASGGDNSGGFGTGIHNNFTGFEGQTFSNWFEFTMVGYTAGAATLSIYNPGRNSTVDPAALYSLYAASSFTFAGLQSGASIGSITLGVADTGVDHWVGISLNSAGLAYLNANLGSTVILGGTTTSSVNPASCFDCVAAFGYNGGFPAATLTVDGVPEPASWALMVAGFGLVGASLRRRHAVTA